ncbi:histidine kinase [Microbacterium dauci]|uniref:Histidine kinase n=1 Tax=Microbacterium dauci TaxID=3048008 RepID=A0ABT6Z9X9_9MICO|nr:histidine kinase [Microbacterium sp. LX3-4]MDJ1112975.1 histidine kinase [Microbacterium sp. LX3-4]
MRTTAIERVAAVFLALEAIGVVALTAWELVALLRGDTAAVSSSIALLVLTLVVAAALAAFAVAVWRGGSWGRSGGIVAQLLILAIAGGTLTGPDAAPATAAAIAAPGVLGFVLLVAASRAAGPRTQRERAEDVGDA